MVKVYLGNSADNAIRDIDASNSAAIVCERLDAMTAKLDALMEYQGLTVREVSTGAYEVVKDTEFPLGDFLNPIPFTAPMQVELGKWYFLDDPQLPAECVQTGLADSYGSPWLDVVG